MLALDEASTRHLSGRRADRSPGRGTGKDLEEGASDARGPTTCGKGAADRSHASGAPLARSGGDGGALALLSGRNRAYGYFHTERLLSQMARMNQAEPLTNALAAWTTQLWHPPEQQPLGNSTAYYIDGHRKPVYTERLIPRGLVGRLRTVLGCRALEDLTLHERAM